MSVVLLVEHKELAHIIPGCSQMLTGALVRWSYTGYLNTDLQFVGFTFMQCEIIFFSGYVKMMI